MEVLITLEKNIKILKYSSKILFIISFVVLLVYCTIVVRVLHVEKNKVVVLTNTVNKQNTDIFTYQTKVTVLKNNLVVLTKATNKIGKDFNTLLSKSDKLDKTKKIAIPK